MSIDDATSKHAHANLQMLDERYFLPLGLFAFSLYPAFRLLERWVMELGVRETICRSIRVFSYLFLLGVYYGYVEMDYIMDYAGHAGHPPHRGEDDKLFTVMKVWVLTSLIELVLSVIVSYTPTQRAISHLMFLERLVSAFYYMNPTCLSRVFSDAISNLLSNIIIFPSVSPPFSSRKTFIMKRALKQLSFAARHLLAFLLVSQMILYIILEYNNVSSIGFSSSRFAMSREQHISFAVWQICMIIIQHVTRWYLEEREVEEDMTIRIDEKKQA